MSFLRIFNISVGVLFNPIDLEFNKDLTFSSSALSAGLAKKMETWDLFLRKLEKIWWVNEILSFFC